MSESHYLTCQDENCERAYCVDRREFEHKSKAFQAQQRAAAPTNEVLKCTNISSCNEIKQQAAVPEGKKEIPYSHDDVKSLRNLYQEEFEAKLLAMEDRHTTETMKLIKERDGLQDALREIFAGDPPTNGEHKTWYQKIAERALAGNYRNFEHEAELSRERTKSAALVSALKEARRWCEAGAVERPSEGKPSLGDILDEALSKHAEATSPASDIAEEKQSKEEWALGYIVGYAACEERLSELEKKLAVAVKALKKEIQRQERDDGGAFNYLVNALAEIQGEA